MRTIHGNTALANLLNDIRDNNQRDPDMLVDQIKDYLSGKEDDELSKYFEIRYYDGCSAMYDENFDKMESIGRELLSLSHLRESSVAKIYGHNLVGIASFNKGDITDAFYHYMVGEELAKKFFSIRMQIIIMMNKCFLLYQEKMYDLFDESIDECIQLAKTHSKDRLVFKALVIKAMRYLEDNQIMNVKFIMSIADNYKHNTENKIDLFYYYCVSFRMKLLSDDKTSSLQFLKMAESCIEDVKIKRFRILLEHEYVRYYLTDKSYDLSQKHLTKAIELCNQLNNFHLIHNNRLLTIELYEQQMMYKEANGILKCILKEKQNSREMIDLAIQKKTVDELLEEKQLGDDKYVLLNNQHQEFMQFKSFYLRNKDYMLKFTKSFQMKELLIMMFDILKNEFEAVGIELHCINTRKNNGTIVFKRYIEEHKKSLDNNKALEYEKNTQDKFQVLFHDYDNGLNECFINLGRRDLDEYVLRILVRDPSNAQALARLFYYLKDWIGYIVNGDQAICKSSKSNQSFEEFLMEFQLTCDLSNRESEIIKKVSEGNTNQIIADQLGITLSTVKNHMNRIFKKLCINNRYELMSYLMEQRIPKVFNNSKG